MLTSFATRFSVARTPCCISDDCVTRMVASMPFLNSWVVAARTTRPIAMATINSTRLKPPAVCSLDRMSLLLPIRRNQGLHLIRLQPALRYRIAHGDDNLANVGIAGHIGDLNLPGEVTQVDQHIRRGSASD